MRITAVLALAALTACAQTPDTTRQADVSMNRLIDQSGSAAAGAVNLFSGAPSLRVGRSNQEIAQDFLDLEFRMESGRALPVLTRFEGGGPITVSLSGQVPASAGADLARLMTRFRNEAGLDVRRAEGPANINVIFVPRRTISATYSNVACFVAPRVASWEEYQAARGTGTLDWTTLRQRERLAIFAPADSTPQEVRDCLHEEIAQAMGPLNDLYQLPDSVFNDDNFHTVLTGFDMLMLRVHYSPELRSGMTRDQVAALLPGILNRLNPTGVTGRTHQGGQTPHAWIRAMEAALGPRGSAAARKAAAQEALAIAHAQGWKASRLAFSWFAVGRLNANDDPVTAANAFANAEAIYRRLPGAQIQAAHVDMQLAALALSQAHPEQAVAFADRAMPVARQEQNASLLATLMLVKAQALEAQGNAGAARAVRLDSQGWARYGFGSDAATKARMRDIASLVPSKLRRLFKG